MEFVHGWRTWRRLVRWASFRKMFSIVFWKHRWRGSEPLATRFFSACTAVAASCKWYVAQSVRMSLLSPRGVKHRESYARERLSDAETKYSTKKGHLFPALHGLHDIECCCCPSNWVASPKMRNEFAFWPLTLKGLKSFWNGSIALVFHRKVSCNTDTPQGNKSHLARIGQVLHESN